MSNDIIDLLAETPADLAELRRRRPEAVENAQRSFEALFEPTNPALIEALPVSTRYAVAAFVAGISGAQRAAEFYADLLADEDEALVAVVEDAVRAGVSTGPYAGGDFVTFGDDALAAAFDFAHLLTFHPKDASPAAIGHLQTAGYSEDAIVSLGQLISFVAFQLRVAHGVQVLAGGAAAGGSGAGDAAVERAAGVADPGWTPAAATLQPEVVAPEKFVSHSLGWKPWVAPLEESEFTDEQRDALIKRERIGMEYFRLLARDPQALKARTLTDLDIFYNTEGGLGRAERELAATVASRLNGCEYCASVHQARSKEEGGDAEAIDRLLDEGVEADLGSDTWDAIRQAAVALTRTPFAFGAEHVEALREVGLDDLAIIDVINSSAFFNWANRLMLTLGAPDVPKRYR
ncbi:MULTISPECIES: alkylhydroperoxidase domain protein [Corynebacterium]|uniref:alkylhydroperoxidase domain protein n=1 Tax=Corynebacterium TaxID=1716 RepID=UPI0008A95DDF|nr:MULTISPECIES: alkylhydroperoxidase domain protein [Corynebacterium]MDK6493160.1 alkylhydroperoxidase domain protein [Corynebacterium coyleae]MDK8798983.1 alkylhydroperoxidase domain protein [Corynebacterium coyleae]OHO29480.1 alkylhydroperoxidase [Corynebacterium sp. HMSC034B08]